MTSTPHVLPDWVVPGAPVVEVNGPHTVRAKIVRITPTGLIRLDNHHMYKLNASYRALHKTGEQGPWIGNHRPTVLWAAAAYLRRQSRDILKAAVAQIHHRMDIDREDPAAVLEQMQAAVDTARTQIAEAERAAADAGYLATEPAVA